ncbi:polyadenylate-binding protein 1-like, partial [Actinia tenebrosa]|uniref:Polyadenylate-binding protein 1-like n=1 Tax=Actinia tenebrosa TaxID=6105 RepID=A0A6P8HRV0_ACTTE
MALCLRLLRSGIRKSLSVLTYQGSKNSTLYTTWPRATQLTASWNIRFLSSLQNQIELTPEKELEKNRRTIFVGGFEAGTTEDILRQYFASFGEVQSVRIVKTFLGYSRNYGFVCFKDPEVADEVLEKKHVILDRDIDVRRAKKYRVVYVGGLPSHFTEKTIRDHFLQFGNVESVQFIDNAKIKSKSGFAFITFNDVNDAKKALEQEKQEIEGYEVKVKPRDASDRDVEAEVSDSKKLKVEGLPFETTVEQLRDHFEQFGQLKAINLLINSKRKMCVGILLFESLEGVENALSNEYHEIEECPVNVARVPDSVNFGTREKAIFIENLASQTTESTILNYFRRFGQIAKVHLVRNPSTGISEGCGVVKFRRPIPAEQFKNISTHLIDGTPVQVRRRGLKLRPALALNEISG